MQSPTYKYVGDGAGIPGLPHIVTTAEAAELGETDVLQAAIQNGDYIPTEAAASLETTETMEPNEPAEPTEPAEQP